MMSYLSQLVKFSLYFCTLIFSCISAEVYLRDSQPNWQMFVVESYANGTPQKIIYYEPHACSDKDYPVKELIFSEDGTLQIESDLTVTPELDVVYHGQTLLFYDSGALKETIPFSCGMIHSIRKTFFENGVLKSKTPYVNSLRQGEYEILSPFDNLVEKGSFQQDKLSGEVARYHLDGKKAYSANFHKGVLAGAEKEWDEKGTLISHAHYRLGFLHSIPNQLALTRYHANGKTSETADFRFGKPQSTHLKHHENGVIAYRCHYLNGQKHGLEETFSEKGDCLGSCKFVKGTPQGDHLQKHQNGITAFSAKYNDLGLLLKPIQEWDEKGKKHCEYRLANDCYDGEYIEYFENGKMKKRYSFVDGEFEGVQWEFFEDETPSLRFEYTKGEKQGTCYIWHKNGHPSKEIHYEKGKCHGPYLMWHENGQPKLETQYEHGYLDGRMTKWSQEGTLLKIAHYINGSLHGTSKEWSLSGALLAEMEYVDSVPQGTVKKWYDTGNLKELTEFQNGKKEGKELAYNSQGQIILEANYENGLLDGPCLTYFDDGTLQKEEFFCAGKPVGLQSEYFPLNCVGDANLAKTSFFLDGKPHGESVCFYPNGKKQAIINYRQGVLHGRKAVWDENDALLEHAFYQKGKLEGKYFSKKEDGFEIVCYYRNNRLNGLYQVFYPSHRIFGLVKAIEAEYRNGLLEGEKVEFNEAGIKISCLCYRNGLKNGLASTYGENGKVLRTEHYENDKQSGPSLEYYPSGSVLRNATYRNGVKVNDEKCYFENGHLKILTPYIDGKIHGCCKEWNDEGDLTSESDYYQGKKNGRLIKYEKGRRKQEFNFENDRLIK